MRGGPRPHYALSQPGEELRAPPLRLGAVEGGVGELEKRARPVAPRRTRFRDTQAPNPHTAAASSSNHRSYRYSR